MSAWHLALLIPAGLLGLLGLLAVGVVVGSTRISHNTQKGETP